MDNRQILERISHSKFRSSFKLTQQEKLYARSKGRAVIWSHARDFVTKRLAPAFPANDGKQTPMRGHPVFKAQHACACCCRGCLSKWHHIPEGRELREEEIEEIVDLLVYWVAKEVNGYPDRQAGQKEKDR